MEENNEALLSVRLSNTRVALQELENELRCCACQQISSRLCSLGMCEHLVCSQCTSDRVSRVCPVCHLPFDVKDIQIQLPLCNILNISNQLREILFNPESDSSCQEPQLNSGKSQKTENEIIFVPSDQMREAKKLNGSPGLKMTPSPIRIKKNSKGETLLHVAVIKGDTEKVKNLLSDGVDVNIKDYAGWTPLHEACNHGHDKIAELLLDNGALINIPGSENDTPLHDAVVNGRVKCVQLLVSRGASLTLRNVHGLMAKDYAYTEAMKEAFNTPVVTDSSTNNLQDISTVDGGPLCILGTALNREQKVELQKKAMLLKAKIVEEFNPEVTHIVSGVNKEGMCPRTLKYLKGVLAGKWIVTIDWLRTCEEYGESISEEPFEVPGTSTNPNSLAPYNGRMNRLKQLPRLFDGCQFYFHGTFNYPTPEKEDLIELVKFGGGHVLSREPKLHSLDPTDLTVPFHAQNSKNEELSHCGLFIIHDNKANYPRVRHKHLCSAPAAWITECIASFSLCALPND
ncbi:BARD1 [Acanthosepion pharaonis]|uniref:BARD1 n=1 Tax=Acanthosepion pharaonis TaxID=158019 RepID=A0A812BR22_ACAPH|nr:BARD1 [Sepia pharaonis]